MAERNVVRLKRVSSFFAKAAVAWRCPVPSVNWRMLRLSDCPESSLATTAFHLVLLVLRMPVMDGYEAPLQGEKLIDKTAKPMKSFPATPSFREGQSTWLLSRR